MIHIHIKQDYQVTTSLQHSIPSLPKTSVLDCSRSGGKTKRKAKDAQPHKEATKNIKKA
jgi:hypothetical protein